MNADNKNAISSNIMDSTNDSGDSEIEIKSTESLDTLKSDETVTPNDFEKSDTEPEWIDLLGSGSIMKKIIKEGTPDSRPKRMQNCKIRYECSLADGTVIETADEFVLQLGDCEVSLYKTI